MSKVEKQKQAQGFQRKPNHPKCADCQHFKCDTENVRGWGGAIFVKERNLRCSIGGFAVGKTSTCNEFQHKVEVKA